MNLNRRHLITGSLAATALHASGVRAQSYPEKPITIVVASAAGGDVDVLARLFADKLSARLGQPVVVENRSGAAGTIGTAHVIKEPADGYALLMAPNTVTLAPHVVKSSQINPVRDLTPISEVATQSLFMVVTAAAGVSSVKEMVASVKAGKIQSYANPGYGTPMHVFGELFAKSANVKIAPIPYRGSAPAVADMLGGHVPMIYTTLGTVWPHIKSGMLVPLAVADPQRSAFLPNVPTLAEQGYKGAEFGTWHSLMGPKGLPAAVVTLLNQHCNEILKMPDVVARMATIAATPVGSDADTLSRLVAADYARNGRLVKEFGIQAQ